MRISNQLIELVLSGGGTEEEKGAVMEFFRDHPEKLAQYLTEGSWEGFEEDVRKGAPRERMLEVIAGKVGGIDGVSEGGRASAARVRRLRYGWVAAAAVVIVIAGAVRLLHRAKGAERMIEVRPAVAAAPVAAGGLRTIENATLKPQYYSLPDGSRVKLSGGSKIRYNSPFINNRRDIYLEGEGIFTAAQDRARPFAVHSGNVITTALGTVFRVSDKSKPVTTVQLYSGRVVVRGKSFSDVYLKPGEQLLLNNSNFTVQIRKEEAKAAAAVEAQPVLLSFTKQSLAEIFNQLQKECSVSIAYDALNLQNTEFTGVFNSEKESLESFLTTLCEINELVLVKTGSRSFSIQAK